MPFKNMPKECFALWEKVYDASKKKGDSEEKAAKKAYGAIKNAGWRKNAEGQWTKKAILEEFSLRIERASFDKASSEKRWRAVASDVDIDHYGDNMSLELFNDFINRIEAGEEVPEEYRSDFWKGGMPYLSVSHYPDLNGKAVPGMSTSVYIDGSYFKAKGIFSDTPIGEKCFTAVCKDLYSEERKSADDKIRISIAFLDYKHKHKGSGYVFERKSLDEWCPECLKELLTGESKGKEFLNGHLVHLALTRVPANPRTNMEVDKSMSIKTRKDDAASIVGEDLAEELDNEAKLVGKSQALVVKSEDELDETEEVGACPEPQEVVEESKTKTSEEQDEEEEEKEGVGKETKEAKKKEKASVASKSEVVMPTILEPLDELKKEISELRSIISAPKPEPAVESHPLDTAFISFKSAFDEIFNSNASYQDKLVALREPYNQLGQSIADEINSKAVEPAITSAPEPTSDIAVQLSTALAGTLQPLMQKMDLVLAQLSASKTAGTIANQVPLPRNIRPTLQMQQDIINNPNQPVLPAQQFRSAIKSETPKLRAILERTV